MCLCGSVLCFASMQLAEERIGNIRTVRAFGQEVAEMEKYTNKVDYVLQLAKKEALARAGFFGAVSVFNESKPTMLCKVSIILKLPMIFKNLQVND